MGWREAMDAAMAAGFGPEDVDHPDLPAPESVVVHWLEEVRWMDPDGYERTDLAHSWKTFPLWMRRAPEAYLAYRRRRHGEKNAWIDYD